MGVQTPIFMFRGPGPGRKGGPRTQEEISDADELLATFLNMIFVGLLVGMAGLLMLFVVVCR